VIGAKVPKERAERFRAILTKAGKVDKTHAILEDNSFVMIPLLGSIDGSLLREYCAQYIELSFPSRKSRKDPIDQIRECAEVPGHVKGLLPDKWERFGTVLVIRLDHQLDRYEKEVARAYASVLDTKTVLRDVGGVSGQYREPVTKLLFGTDTVTTHLENGINYRFDAAKIMFSSGNVEERMRMSEIPCQGETVLDMFAGIGYFSLPIAVYQNPKKVIACEINPVAHQFLVENIGLNGVKGVVEPVLGDNRDLPGTGFADRIIMGYVRTTHEFVPTAMRYLRDGGVIHYHETCPNELLPNRPLERILSGAKGRRVEVCRFKHLKSYSPGVTHVVIDARVFRAS